MALCRACRDVLTSLVKPTFFGGPHRLQNGWASSREHAVHSQPTLPKGRKRMNFATRPHYPPTFGIENNRTLVSWNLPLVNTGLLSCNNIWNSALDVPKLVAMTNGLPMQNHCGKHVQTKLLPDMENPDRSCQHGKAGCLLTMSLVGGFDMSKLSVLLGNDSHTRNR